MPNLSIKNVPESMLDDLRRRAADNHRSLQGELMAILTQSLQTRPPAQAATAPAATPPDQGRTIEQIAAAHRAARTEPIESGPLAVDIIRAERDAR